MAFTAKFVAIVALVFAVPQILTAAEKTYTEGGTEVTYDAVSDEYAIAIAKTVEAARTIAHSNLGYEMPPLGSRFPETRSQGRNKAVQ